MNVCQYIDSVSETFGGGGIFACALNIELNKTGKAIIITRNWRDEQETYTSQAKVKMVFPSINFMYEAKYSLINVLKFEIQNAKVIQLLHNSMREMDVLQVHGETVPLVPHVSLPKPLVFHPWMVVKKPVCLTMHALWSLFDPEAYINNSERRMFEKADHIVVVEKFMKEIIVRRYEVDENKISYLPSGISVEKAAGADARSPLPSDVLPSDRRILFTASRLSVEKNVDMIIKAASILLRPKKDVVFLIAGTGPMMFELKKLASTLGVSNKVIFLGFVDNRTVLAIMRKCYAVINPTNLPGASKLTMEAFANKKPVVRANALDTHPVIDFTSGLLYNPEDPNDLAEKLDILLTDECFAKKLGKRGYRIVKDEYDLSKVAKGYIRIYDELIN